METREFKILAIDYVTGDLNEKERIELEKLMSEDPQKLKTFQNITNIWKKLDQLKTPEPSNTMDEEFYKMLSSKKERNHKVPFLLNVKNALSPLFPDIAPYRLIYGICVLLIGFGLGYFVKNINISETISFSNSDTDRVREKLAIILLEQPSASYRLEGVYETDKLKSIDEKVINALLKTLNNDSNVNVRLAAITSLSKFSDNPSVREGLIQAITKQDAPILQVTLADLMVSLQEKTSIRQLKLLLSQTTNTLVRQKIESSIQSLL